MITFHKEDLEFELENTEKIEKWISDIITEEGATLTYINYIFCSDTYLYNINLQYLSHDTYTDIITFPYSKTSIESDIFISIDRIRENADTFNTTFSRELHRVIIHGVLHLIGYSDKTPEDQQKMREKEDTCLEKITDIL